MNQFIALRNELRTVSQKPWHRQASKHRHILAAVCSAGRMQHSSVPGPKNTDEHRLILRLPQALQRVKPQQLPAPDPANAP